jgi:hypothetical protein
MSRPTRDTPAGRAYLDLQNRARADARGTQELLILYVVERVGAASPPTRRSSWAPSPRPPRTRFPIVLLPGFEYRMREWRHPETHEIHRRLERRRSAHYDETDD